MRGEKRGKDIHSILSREPHTFVAKRMSGDLGTHIFGSSTQI